MAKRVKIIEKWQDASYDPMYLWESTKQPLHGLGATVGDYTSIAHRAVEDLQSQITGFLKDLGLTYAEIHHSEFRESYENTALGFRDWFEEQCKKHEQNPQSDVLIIGPSVKPEASSERKVYDEKKSNPDNIRDYLRFLVVTLKTKNSTKARQRHGRSFDVLEQIINRMESGLYDLPRKNQLWLPHEETGHRSYKSRWTAADSEDPDMRILAEGKWQQEAQMDVDKLTRYFLTTARESLRLKKNFGASTAKRSNVRAREANEKARFVSTLGMMLFDRVHADAGFNARFLDPKSEKHATVPQIWQIDEFIYENLSLFTPFQQNELLKRIANSNVLPKSSEFYTAPEHSRA